MGNFFFGDFSEDPGRHRIRFEQRLVEPLAGAPSALLGVGGGIVKVTLMHLAMGVPMKFATATIKLMFGITATSSAVIYLMRDEIIPYIAGPVALGVFVGARLFAGRHRPPAFDGNPRAQDSLGISDRERAVLLELAAGRSNKEIARELHIAPSTVKTHVARLYEKLGARRRTEAVRRARELGLVP
jgi:DNA-binding CsgD family transcriptional regulator